MPYIFKNVLFDKTRFEKENGWVNSNFLSQHIFLHQSLCRKVQPLPNAVIIPFCICKRKASYHTYCKMVYGTLNFEMTKSYP